MVSNVVPLAGSPPELRVPNGGESQSVRKICALPGVVPGLDLHASQRERAHHRRRAFWIDTFSRELGPAGPVSIVTPLTPSPPTPPVVAEVGTEAHTMLGAELLLLNEVSRQTSLAVPAGPNASATDSPITSGEMATGGEGRVIGAFTVPPDSEIVVSHAFDVFAVESVNGGPTAPPPATLSCTGPVAASRRRCRWSRPCSGCSSR